MNKHRDNECCMIKWDVHPDPSPIWFPSEDHYNKFSFQLSFEEYLRKYSAEQSKSNEEQLIKDGKDSSQPTQGKIALESKTEDKASEIKKVEIKVKDEEIPQPGHSDHIKGLNGTKKSNKANTQESFALIFPQLAWPYPCSSSITKKEQQFYMENFFNYRQQNPKLKSDSMILSKLKELDQRVKHEQAQFQDFLQKHAQSNPARYLFLQPGFRYKIKASLESQIGEIKEKLTHNYELEKTISLVSGIAFYSDPVMQHVKAILGQGKICALRIPKMNSVIDVNQLTNAEPLSGYKIQDNKVDEQMLDLSLEHKIDVVISSLSLVTLVDNQSPEFSKSWKIPIEIKLRKRDNTASSKKVVIIGNPLPPNILSTREANYICYREALKGTMPDQSRSITFPFETSIVVKKVEDGQVNLKRPDGQQGKFGNKNGEDQQAKRTGQSVSDNIDDGAQMDYIQKGSNILPGTQNNNVETYERGKDISCSVTVQDDKHCLKDEDNTRKAECSKGKTGIFMLETDVGSANDKNTRPDAPVKSMETCQTEIPSNMLKVRVNNMPGAPDGKSELEAGKTDTPNGTSNFRLDIWKLGKISLLVKSSYDGYAVGSEHDGKKNDTMYKIFPKTEYKSKFGMEEFSVSELTNAWWDSYLCTDSRLLCVRIDPRTNGILRLDDFHHSNLVGPNCPFQPKVSMKLLHNMLKDIMGQEDVGSYMLTHNKGDIHACLYREVEGKQGKHCGGYKLVKDYDSGSEDWPIKDDSLSWLRFDTNIILPIYTDQRRVPCLFPLPEELGVPEQDKPVNNSGKNKRKGKGKAKKNAKIKKQKQTIHAAAERPETRGTEVVNYGDLDLDF